MAGSTRGLTRELRSKGTARLQDKWERTFKKINRVNPSVRVNISAGYTHTHTTVTPPQTTTNEFGSKGTARLQDKWERGTG